MILSLLLACGPCGDDRACKVGDREFYALPPEGWDGQSALPVVVFAHGYHSSPEKYMGKEEVVRGFSDGGALLVLPEAIAGEWSVNAGGGSEEDLDYIAEVMQAAGERWPLDDTRRVVGGFSVGASFAYVVACARPDLFTGAAPRSGGFWEPMPEGCEGPVTVSHEHGSADQTWPMEGRELWEDAIQGDAKESFALLLQSSGCSGDAREEAVDDLSCAVYEGCTDGRVQRFCMHAGEHQLWEGWVQRLLQFHGI